MQELAKKKQEQKALLASTAEERALERAAVARAKRAAAAEAAAATVKAIGEPQSSFQALARVDCLFLFTATETLQHRVYMLMLPTYSCGTDRS